MTALRTSARPAHDPVPTSGKISVNVINHSGDEVMMVYPIEP